MLSEKENEVKSISKNDSMEDLFVGMEVVEESGIISSESALSDIKDLNLDVVCPEESTKSTSSPFSFLDDDDDEDDDDDNKTSDLFVDASSSSCQEEISKLSRDDEIVNNHLTEEQERYDTHSARDSEIVDRQDMQDNVLRKKELDDILNLGNVKQSNENSTTLDFLGNADEEYEVIDRDTDLLSISKLEINKELLSSSKTPENTATMVYLGLSDESHMKIHNLSLSSFSQENLTNYQHLSLQIDLLKAKQEEIKEIFESYNTKKSILIKKWEEDHLSEEVILERIQGLKIKQKEYEIKENYDEAIETNRMIQEMEERYENYRFQHPISSGPFLALVNEYLHTYDMQEKKQNELINSLKSLYDKHSCLKITDNIEIKEFEKDILEVKEEMLKVDRSLGHIKLDKEHLAKTEGVLQKEISKNTKDLEIEKEDLLEKKRKVQNDIAELKRQLITLEEEESFYVFEIDAIQCKIDNILLEFKPKVTEIENEIDVSTKKENQLINEMDILQTREQRLLEQLEEKEDDKKRYRELVESLKNYIGQLETQKDYSTALPLDQIVNMDYLKNTNDEDYLSAKNNLKKTKSNFDILSSNLFEKENRKRSVQRAVNDIETQLSELHKTKQLAVKEKNYQEAKRVSGEMTQLTVEGESKQKVIDQLTVDIKKNKEEISIIKSKLEKEKKIHEKMKSDQDQRIVRYLKKMVQEIRSYMDSHPDGWMYNILQLEVKHSLSIINKIKQEMETGNHNEEKEKKPNTSSPTIEELESQLEHAEVDEDWDLAESLSSRINDLTLET